MGDQDLKTDASKRVSGLAEAAVKTAGDLKVPPATTLDNALSEVFRKLHVEYSGKLTGKSLAEALTEIFVNNDSLQIQPVETGNLMIALIRALSGADPEHQIEVKAKSRGNLTTNQAKFKNARRAMALGNYLDHWQGPREGIFENFSGHLLGIAQEIRVSRKYAHEALRLWRSYRDTYPSKLDVRSDDDLAALISYDPNLAAFALFSSKSVNHKELCSEWPNSGD